VSILFATPTAAVDAEQVDPAFFGDLNLDQVIASIIAGRQEYNLAPFFYTRLQSVDGVRYRHEVMRDLENDALRRSVVDFAHAMHNMRADAAYAAKLHHRYQRESWILEAVDIYVDAVTALTEGLTKVELHSRGLLALREYLRGYTESDEFNVLDVETKKLTADLRAIKYCVSILGTRVKVTRYDGEADYGAEVLATFERFKQGAVKDYRVAFSDWPDLNTVETRVLDLVAKLYPEVFSALDSFCERRRNYLDHTVSTFDREVQFYLSYRAFIAPLEDSGLAFCYPQVSDTSKDVSGQETFDLALAAKLAAEKSPVVCNDFYLADPERILVISGPNQGGKTTLARTFGQLHHLASLGLPVPGSEARLFLFDEMFTHFERGENLKDLNGKLQDDLLRIHRFLERVTPNSIIIMNEIFTSTTLDDAIFLGRQVLEQIVALDVLCVCVTFVDELASLGPTIVSMVSTVVPEDPATRTYKLERRPADGLAYAIAIAEKYGLTFEALKARIAS
jgi:hypothetical protein